METFVHKLVTSNQTPRTYVAQVPLTGLQKRYQYVYPLSVQQTENIRPNFKILSTDISVTKTLQTSLYFITLRIKFDSKCYIGLYVEIKVSHCPL
jgi:hypothetical protein